MSDTATPLQHPKYRPGDRAMTVIGLDNTLHLVEIVSLQSTFTYLPHNPSYRIRFLGFEDFESFRPESSLTEITARCLPKVLAGRD